jgi:hypothetical protein
MIYKDLKLGWMKWLTSVIPAIREAEIQRITVWGQSEQKVSETQFQPKQLGVVAHACHPNYMGGHWQEDCSAGLPWQKLKTVPEK